MQITVGLGLVSMLAAVASGQGITKVSDFTAGPTKLGMYVYVPKTLASPAPILLAIHHCQGSAQGYSTETHYQPLADKHGFVIIYPNSRSSGGCFDVSSTACKPPLPGKKSPPLRVPLTAKPSPTTAAATARPWPTWSST